MSVIFSSIINGNVTMDVYLLCALAACVCGVITAVAAAYRATVSKSFLTALILLPIIVETVIIMVNGNIGTGVAVMGAFSLIRFRSAAGKAKDIAMIFLAMTAGLSCAAGYIGIALIFTLIVGVLACALAHIPMGAEKMMDLRITVPETLSIHDAFEDLFNSYTKRHRLIRTKTSNMGSLYKLEYQIQMKNADQIKEFIDALRCRNGNLEIALSNTSEMSDEL